MDTKGSLLNAALSLIEREGEASFSTRAVCSLANVTAPTLYHHFGSADGLLSAAIAEAFRQFLSAKQSAVQSADPVTALCEGWDSYVDFAASRPRLYAAMLARFLAGADLPAARQGHEMLRRRIAEIEAAGRLAIAPETAVQIAWASANAAAMLHVGTEKRANGHSPPDPAAVAGLREWTVGAICKPLSLEDHP
jgi:AcrR family transcriptional regulator